MVGHRHNSVFLQWLAAYGSHLEQVAQGSAAKSGDESAEHNDKDPEANEPAPED